MNEPQTQPESTSAALRCCSHEKDRHREYVTMASQPRNGWCLDCPHDAVGTHLHVWPRPPAAGETK